MALPKKPITRQETYLSNIAGQATALPSIPRSREEMYLDYIAKNGGQSGGGDMTKAAYDSDDAVFNAGGIKAYVSDAIGEIDEVVANPSGEATDDLEKIQIGDDIFSIPEGGDSSLSSAVTANTTVGAISSGTTLAQGTTFTEFCQKLLISEIAPTTTFTASGSGTKETGTSVTPTLTLTITGTGTGTPTSIKFYNGSTLLDTQTYEAGTNSYSYTMTDAITTTSTVKGVLEYTKSDSSTGSVEKTATYTFVMASYYGAVTTAPTDKSGITALTKVVKTGKGQTATFNLTNQRSCYCYPASMGDLTSIKDANNFEYLSSYTKTTVSVDGTNYNVYTLTDAVTASGFKQVYA